MTFRLKGLLFLTSVILALPCIAVLGVLKEIKEEMLRVEGHIVCMVHRRSLKSDKVNYLAIDARLADRNATRELTRPL